MILGIFKITLRLRDRHVFYVTISESFKRFQYFNLEQIFWKIKTFFKKLEYCFLVETTKIENTSFPFKTALSEANVKTNRMATTKWTYHKEWSFASNYFIFLGNLFQFQNLLKRVYLIYQPPKFPYSIFRKRWSLILECFFPVSILKQIMRCSFLVKFEAFNLQLYFITSLTPLPVLVQYFSYL